jgi:hypothetical protein
MASGWRSPTGMPFYRPVHTGPLAELVSYFFAAALGLIAGISTAHIRTHDFALNHNLGRCGLMAAPAQISFIQRCYAFDSNSSETLECMLAEASTTERSRMHAG